MKLSRSVLLTTVLAIAPSMAMAEDPNPAPQQVEIKRLMGKWSGQGTIFTEGKTHKVTMTWDCADASGVGTKCKGVILGLPGFTYQFDDLWGYSTADGLVHWYTVTNAGEVHDHRGHLDGDGGLVAVELPTEGKLFSEVITFKRRNKTLMMSWVTTLGGTLRERGEIELTAK